MLSNTLVTNEVKKSDGTEIEFQRRESEGRTTVFSVNPETPSRPHLLKISHLETGSGTNLRRRSRVGIYKTVDGDATDTSASLQAYIVTDFQVGNLQDQTEMKNVLAELLSFCASTGADTAIKFDCTGNGAVSLLNGTL